MNTHMCRDLLASFELRALTNLSGSCVGIKNLFPGASLTFR